MGWQCQISRRRAADPRGKPQKMWGAVNCVNHQQQWSGIPSLEGLQEKQICLKLHGAGETRKTQFWSWATGPLEAELGTGAPPEVGVTVPDLRVDVFSTGEEIDSFCIPLDMLQKLNITSYSP